MPFSRTELELTAQIGNGNKEVPAIAAALKISPSQVYRICQTLSQKGILTLKDGTLQPEMKTHVNLLLTAISHTPNLAIPLSGTGLEIFLCLLEPKTVKEVEKETGLHKTTIHKKIYQGRKMSILTKEHTTYRVNEKIWQEVRAYLTELKRYEESIDTRVPVNSTIYFKNKKEIVFSTKEALDATPTAFSAYKNEGIKLLTTTDYYSLPKKNLTRKNIFIHSLKVAEKDLDPRTITFVALFYAKYKKELRNISHPILSALHKIFEGGLIPNYPTLQEIKDRAEVYDIKI
ncbi:helix-turn-helix domain-containing protein [Candidatus Woesearchaeota archaeon]|nr:helix-turn-helix domain-containing protein [Candidatus Woesearchaeota archaeon]